MTFDITRWPDKDPNEQVNVAFDFSAATASVSSPTISVSVRWQYGPTADATPAAILSGTPTIVGAVVYQRVIGGVDKVDYLLTCTATSAAGEVLEVPAIQPVRLKR